MSKKSNKKKKVETNQVSELAQLREQLQLSQAHAADLQNRLAEVNEAALKHDRLMQSQLNACRGLLASALSLRNCAEQRVVELTLQLAALS